MGTTATVGLSGAGVYYTGKEVVSIANDWDKMDGIDRYHRVGMLVGPMLGGGRKLGVRKLGVRSGLVISGRRA